MPLLRRIRRARTTPAAPNRVLAETNPANDRTCVLCHRAAAPLGASLTLASSCSSAPVQLLIADGRSVGLTSLSSRGQVNCGPNRRHYDLFPEFRSTKRVLILPSVIHISGIAGHAATKHPCLVIVLQLLVSGPSRSVGTSAVISILMPYESFPIRLRGRATGWVAGCSKWRGYAQGLAALALVPAFRRHRHLRFCRCLRY